MNHASVRFWQAQGIRRIILSRELSLEQIAEIRQACPDIELEVFVHGALCIAYSGRCLLSGYFNHRDANQGSCTNSCRWQYDVKPAEENETGDVVMKDLTASTTGSGERHQASQGVYLITEHERPDSQMPIEEDEHGTYIMNSKDLRAVEHVQRLVEIGVDSLKIEGRTKSHYYAARTAQVYRRAIDDAVAGRPFDPSLLGTLENLANRGYTEGFYQRHPDQNYQNYLDNYSRSTKQRFVGEISAFDQEHGLAEVQVKNRFAVGDRLQVLSPVGNSVVELQHIESEKGETMEVAPGGGYVVHIPLPPGNYDNGLLAQILE
jgi:putative protease